MNKKERREIHMPIYGPINYIFLIGKTPQSMWRVYVWETYETEATTKAFSSLVANAVL